MNTEQLTQLIFKALEHRKPLEHNWGGYRLVDGSGDQIPGLYMDLYGNVILAHLHFTPTQTETVKRTLTNIAPDLSRQFKTKSIFIRRHIAAGKSADNHANLLWGEGLDQVVLAEGAASFIVRPQTQANAGLFLDMRDVRARIFTVSPGARVLNLFCFTGSLGIVAALGGAIKVVQVDSSKAALRWARENQSLNKITSEILYVEEDACTYIEREVKRIKHGKEKYDLILIDPPTFGRSKKGTFNFQRSLRQLAGLALQVASDKAQIMFAGNGANLTPAQFTDLFKGLSRELGVRIKSTEDLWPPKMDFRSSRATSIAMRGVWVSL